MVPSRRGRRQQRRRTAWLVVSVLVAGALVAGYYMMKPKSLAKVVSVAPKPSTTPTGPVNPALSSPSTVNPAPTAGEQVTLPPEATAGAQLALSLKNGQPVSILKLDGSGKATDVGTSVNLPDESVLSLQNTAQGWILVKAGHLPQHAAATVDLNDPSVVPAAGGEPTFKAFAVVSGQVQPLDYYATVAPKANKPDEIIVDKGLNALWLYQGGKLVLTKRVATGRYIKGPFPSGANQLTNYVTPKGTFTIGKKIEDPPYYAHGGVPGGDPRNPLGTRFMGLNVYQGDAAGVWAIHGTNEPDKIGQWVSDGCIRLKTSDVEQLFGMVQVGTTVEVIDSVN